MRYLTVRGNVHCGMHLLRQISVGHLSDRGNVHRGCVWSGKCLSGICLVGEVSVGDVSGWGNIRQGCVWFGKSASEMCLVGEMFVGEVSVEDVSGNLVKLVIFCEHYKCMTPNEVNGNKSVL